MEHEQRDSAGPNAVTDHPGRSPETTSGLVREIGVTYSGQLIGSGLGFVVQLFLQRVMEPSDYGILALATSVGTLTVVLTDIGISHAMVRYGSRYLVDDPARAGSRFAAALLMRLVLAAVVSLVGFASARWLAVDVFSKPDLVRPLAWVFLGMAGATLYGYWMFLIQTHQRFGVRSLVTIVTAAVRLAVVVAIWSAALLTPTAMVVVDAGVNLTGFLLGLGLSPRKMFNWDPVRLRRAARELLAYSRFTGILIIGDTVFNELDTFMLGALAEEAVVGLYRAAWTYAMVLGFLTQSVSNVLFPKITSTSDVAWLGSFMKRTLKLTSLLALCTLPALPLVAIWVPWWQAQYEGAVPIFYIMYFGLVFELVFGPLSYVLYSLDRPGVLVAAALIKIGLNVTGNMVLIPLYGAEGAAVATVITRVLGGAIAVGFILQTYRRHSMRPSLD